MKIDTSTTAGKIAVMQGFEDGKKIMSTEYRGGWAYDTAPCWDWSEFEYKLKSQTVEEAANDYLNQSDECTLSPGHAMSFTAGAKWREESSIHLGTVSDYRKKTFTFNVVHCNGAKLEALKIRADLIDGDKTFEIDLSGSKFDDIT